VVEYSAAAESELKVDDLILELNGTPVNDMLTLRQILNKFEAGHDVELKVRRSGKKKDDEFKLTLGVAPTEALLGFGRLGFFRGFDFNPCGVGSNPAVT